MHTINQHSMARQLWINASMISYIYIFIRLSSVQVLPVACVYFTENSDITIEIYIFLDEICLFFPIKMWHYWNSNHLWAVYNVFHLLRGAFRKLQQMRFLFRWSDSIGSCTYNSSYLLLSMICQQSNLFSSIDWIQKLMHSLCLYPCAVHVRQCASLVLISLTRPLHLTVDCYFEHIFHLNFI